MGLFVDSSSEKYNLILFTIVKVQQSSWGFILSIPNGKSVRIFSWSIQPDNDKTYEPRVHYVKGLNLPTHGGFHKKYELIPQGYCVSDMYNL